MVIRGQAGRLPRGAPATANNDRAPGQGMRCAFLETRNKSEFGVTGAIGTCGRFARGHVKKKGAASSGPLGVPYGGLSYAEGERRGPF